MTHVQVWAHPWSLSDAGARDRLDGLDVDGVRVAFAYHSARWLSHATEPGKQVTLGSGAWFNTENIAWESLTPASNGRHAEKAMSAIRGEGREVIAWVVGLHNSALATSRPDLAITSAFGHRYAHALCPAQPEVVDYAARLVQSVATHAPDALDLEAFAYLGWGHSGEHVKSSAALRPLDRWLLSICCCSACEARFRAAGIDVDKLKNDIRRGIRQQLADPQPQAVNTATLARDVLGDDVIRAVLAARARVVESLVSATVDMAEGCPVLLRSTSDVYECAGKSAGDLGRLARLVGELTFTDFQGSGERLVREVDAATLRGIARDKIAVGWAADPRKAVDNEILTTLMGSGLRAVSLYAYDLIPPRVLDGHLSSLRRHDVKSFAC